jgi:hypothetical protein
LHYEQECRARAEMKSTARMKALADEADMRRRQVLAAVTLADKQLCRGANNHSPSATAAIVEIERLGRRVAERTSRLAALALAAEQERREAAEHALALAAEQERREAADHALALATAALAAALQCRDEAERTSALAISMLADVRKRQQAAEHAQMSANIVPPNAVQCWHSGDAAIERIRTEFALCAAPLDAILAEIACQSTALETAPSPHRPTSYVDAVLSTMGGGTQTSLPLALSPSSLAPAAPPSPDVDGQLQLVRQHARPRRRTGRRNCPRAPSPPDSAPPSHPHQMLGGLHTPASTKLARATSLCRSVVSSTTPSSMAPPTPSLQPVTFLGDLVHSLSGGGATYPFRVCGPTPPPRKRTRRKLRPCRVCRRHGPRAPDQVEPLLCGRRHRPRAPNQSTCDGWD